MMDTITIELRSRLRSCNIFISTSGAKTTKSGMSSSAAAKNTISLKLKESEITLKIGNKTAHLALLNSVKIIPKSLSSLTVTDDWISLRVQTEPTESAYGSFKREIVGADEEDSSLKLSNKEARDVEIALKDKDLVLLCARCKNLITDVIRFARVLPLPSDNSDPGEWFCCSHTAASAAGGSLKLISEPSVSDCFYERDYRVFSKNIFRKEVNIPEKNERDNKKTTRTTTTTIRCNRCLSGIGVSDSERVKLWNCCIDYKFIEAFSGANMTASDPLKDFSSVVLNGTDIFTGNKILVQANDDDRSHYLLIRVMDKNLELLTEKDVCHLPANNDNNDDNEKADYTVELTSIKVAKVLYKYSETETDIKNYSLDVDRCHVALPVMLAAVEHLSTSTKRYPPSCRVIDKYFVGYITS